MRHWILLLTLLALPAAAHAQLTGGAIRTGTRVVPPAVRPVEVEEASNPDRVCRPVELCTQANPTIGEEFQALLDVFQRKWNELGGSPGARHGDPIPQGDGYYQQYDGGRIYYRPDHPLFYVYGAIGTNYAELGGANSWLGWPTSDEQDMSEGGRVSTFERGAIYWWPDTGAIDMGEVVVRYAGIHCFGETDWDQASSADEPYLTFAVVPAFADQAAGFRTNIYEEVDAGESRADAIELYRGSPYGLSMLLNLWEYDFGNQVEPDEVASQAADKGAHAVAGATAAIPAVGPAIAVAVEVVWNTVGEDMMHALYDDFFDFDDDRLNTIHMTITAKDMIVAADNAEKRFGPITYDIETPLMVGEKDAGSTYKAYFVVESL
jgi:LGFP repeat-containing protein